MIIYELIQTKLNHVKRLDQEKVCEEVEETALLFGLHFSKRMTLCTKKGSYHWHLKKAKEKGVLEVTYWPRKEQFSLEIHQNRKANWNEELIETMSVYFSENFGGEVINKEF